MTLGPGVVAPIVWTFALDVLSSVASELRNRIFHSPSVRVEQIPYARWLQYQTFATFSVVVPVEGRPERLGYYHQMLLQVFCAFTKPLPSLKQNLMQIRCSFTTVILAGRYDRKTALTQSHKNAEKQHTCPHSRTPLGRIIHKG